MYYTGLLLAFREKGVMLKEGEMADNGRKRGDGEKNKDRMLLSEKK